MKNEYHTTARVVITRPASQGERLAGLVRAAGGTPLIIPALEIGETDQPEVARTYFDRLDDFKYLIFISPNAVQHSVQYFDPAALTTQVTVAIGASTAHAMEQESIPCHLCPEGNYSSETLLDMPELQDVDGQNVLIIRGNGGRALLGVELEKRGATVNYAQVYQRRIPPLSKSLLNEALEHNSADMITANSVETLENARLMTNDHLVDNLLNLTLVAGSSRVVDKARDLGFKQEPLLAAGPDDGSIMQAISLWSNSTDTTANNQDQNTMTTPPSTPDSKLAPETSGIPNGDAKSQPDTSEQLSDSNNQSSSRDRPPQGSQTPMKTDSATSTEPTAEQPRSDKASAAITTPPAKPVKRSGAGVAWLALLIALLSAAGVGWMWWQGQQTGPDPLANLEIPNSAEIIATVKADTDRFNNRVTSKLDRQEQQLEEVLDKQSEFSSALRTQKNSVENLTEQLQQSADAMSAMRGVSASVRNTWVRAETEYFLQTANTRLQLAGDVKSAKQALKAADERIVALGDPSLTPVRAQLNEDMLALESVPALDVEGIALTLNSLAGRVSKLTRLNATPDNFTRVNTNSEEKPSAWGNAKNAMSSAFTDIIRVSPSDGSNPAMLAPEESYFLYRNLELQLQAARIAAMQNQQRNFDASLQSALQWLEQYFDPADAGVIAVRDRLLDLQKQKITRELPDISKSLTMLRAIAPGTRYSVPAVVQPATEITP